MFNVQLPEFVHKHGSIVPTRNAEWWPPRSALNDAYTRVIFQIKAFLDVHSLILDQTGDLIFFPKLQIMLKSLPAVLLMINLKMFYM